MLENMKLSEQEKKGVKLRVAAREKGKRDVSHAIGKIFSKKLTHQEAVALALGKACFPIKGIECKELGDNVFIFTFNQESGKRRALEDGPWMFDKDLIVMEDYVPSRRIDREGGEESEKREGAGDVHARGVLVEKAIAEKKGSERKEGKKYKRVFGEKGGMGNEGKREEVLGHKRSKIKDDVEETANKNGSREEVGEVKEATNTTTSVVLQEQPHRE
ncbi:LRR receptor-like serine/threonine-protein kinase FLS2 [Hordeum vulgare]|nr:LRR receptor-like serine/threonine-protein kinase FLS2 [Hordeum vulgare]